MTNFIKYKDELINLDFVASISKDMFYDDTTKIWTIKFYGAYTYSDNSCGIISCLHFETEEIRDKVFNDICYNIEFNFRSTFIEIKNEQ